MVHIMELVRTPYAGFRHSYVERRHRRGNGALTFVPEAFLDAEG